MKANELRIDNYVLNDRVINKIIAIAEPLGIVGLRTPQGNLINAQIDLIKSIPLTEEWLLKFGFEVINRSGTNFWSKDIEVANGNHLDLYLHFHIKNGEIVNSGLTSGEIDNEYGYVQDERTHLENSIKYVHQLQNLYFALTGKELIYEPS